MQGQYLSCLQYLYFLSFLFCWLETAGAGTDFFSFVIRKPLKLLDGIFYPLNPGFLVGNSPGQAQPPENSLTGPASLCYCPLKKIPGFSAIKSKTCPVLGCAFFQYGDHLLLGAQPGKEKLYYQRHSLAFERMIGFQPLLKLFSSFVCEVVKLAVWPPLLLFDAYLCPSFFCQFLQGTVNLALGGRPEIAGGAIKNPVQVIARQGPVVQKTTNCVFKRQAASSDMR